MRDNQPAVLVVDDDAHVRAALRRALFRYFRVEVAADYHEALATLSHRSFDAVITDFNMPGTDGGELLRFLAHERPSARRVMISASPPPSASVFAELVLRKPWPSDLASRISVLLATDRSAIR